MESGHHGNLWLDLDALFLKPANLRPFTSELARRLNLHHPEAICGPLSGGAFLAQTLASTLDLEFFHTERSKNSGSASVDYTLPRNLRRNLDRKRVALVDDAINAGSALTATLAQLQACGAKPVAVGSLLVLGAAWSQFSSQHHLPVEFIAQLPNVLWTQAECPLCAAGVPLDAA